MSAQPLRKPVTAQTWPEPTSLDPNPKPAQEPRWHGKRRREQLKPVEPVPIRWPMTRKLQYEMFDTWHSASMQIIHEAKASFRTMAVLWRFINWKEGIFFPTNATLAACAGGCSEKTITRDIAEYEALGLLIVDHNWRKNAAGKWVTTRVLSPALPRRILPNIHFPDTRGQWQELELRWDL